MPINAPGVQPAQPEFTHHEPLSPLSVLTSVDSLFLAVPRVSTFLGSGLLTAASGFLFENNGGLYLVTSRHVVRDEAVQHTPDRLEIELHVDCSNLTKVTRFSVPLYDDGVATWRQGADTGGAIDVAVIEINRTQLPDGAIVAAFNAHNLVPHFDEVSMGESLLVVGFPLGFHDTLHHLPVVRQAIVASPYGMRFQGQGYFLTDARTHRGISGAPVVMRGTATDAAETALPWKLLGVHSSRMDMGDRDQVQDESLGLNCVWYADILLTLTCDPQWAHSETNQ